MNIKIGAKIKALRKRDNITQERLAEVLGLTSQAISKWESESGYPDIEYITPIANFFNVTIDNLFDYDIAEKRRKINEHCDLYDAHVRESALLRPHERIPMIRQALAEFPAEEKLLIRLAEALYDTWSRNVHSDYEIQKSQEGWEEAEKIFQELLDASVDDSIRSKCRIILANIYSLIGEHEKVLAIAEKCDTIPNTKEVILANAFNSIVQGNKDIYDQKLIISLLNQLYPSISRLRFDKDKSVIIKMYSNLINFYKCIFGDGNFGKFNEHLMAMYEYIAWALIDRGESVAEKELQHEPIDENKADEAFEALENAYKHAKMMDIYTKELRGKGEYEYSSIFFNKMKDSSSDVISAVNAVPYLLDVIKANHWEYFVKNPPHVAENIYIKNFCHDARFTALVSKIEADIEEM